MQKLRARLENERAIYEAMCETANLYRQMYGDDLDPYLEDVRRFVERQDKGKKRTRSLTPNTGHTPEPSHQDVLVPAVAPILKTAGRFKEPKTYKGKSLRELNEFLASVRGTF